MSAQFKKVIVFGCGGHSRSIADVFLSYHPEVSLVFVDPAARPNEKIYNFAVLKEICVEDNPYFFAIGDNDLRKKKFEEIGSHGLISIISLKAYLGCNTDLGKGLFVGNFCHIGPQAKIGDNTILNNGCVIEHEVVIGSHCHIGPNAVISGRCTIGDQVFIGVGATVKDSVQICSNVVVGAGATIVKDITQPGIYVGCPGKKIK